jgi:hypothetical protein
VLPLTTTDPNLLAAVAQAQQQQPAAGFGTDSSQQLQLLKLLNQSVQSQQQP